MGKDTKKKKIREIIASGVAVFLKKEKDIVISEEEIKSILFHGESKRFLDKVTITSDKIIGEIEVRTTADGKYPSMLFNMLKLRAIDLLEKEIPKIKKLNPNLYVYGEAISLFTL